MLFVSCSTPEAGNPALLGRLWSAYSSMLVVSKGIIEYLHHAVSRLQEGPVKDQGGYNLRRFNQLVRLDTILV